MLIEDVASPEAVTDLAERILESLRLPVRLGTKTVSAACSIGIAFDEEGITSEQLLRNADIAMYQAKKRGKDRFEVYRHEMHTFVLARIELEEELRAAISGDDLVAHYQPVVDLQTPPRGRASRRWCGGRTRRARSSTPATSCRWPWRSASSARSTRASSARPAARYASGRRPASAVADLEIGVNLSAGQLVDEMLSDRIAAAIARVPVRPPFADHRDHRERGAHRRRRDPAQPGRAARASACASPSTTSAPATRPSCISTGLPVDIVKIDKSFVDTLGTGDDSPEHGRGADPAGPHARLRDDRRGRRDRRPGGEPAPPGLRARPGLPPRPAARRRRRPAGSSAAHEAPQPTIGASLTA